MTCNACNRTIYDRLMSKTSPDNKIWHSDCLRCCECHKLLDSKYFETSGRLYCRNDYLAYFGPSCFSCAGKITDDQYFFSIKQQTISASQSPDLQTQSSNNNNTLFFHDKCFACNYCARPLQKGDKYCILDAPQPPMHQQQQPPSASPIKSLMICHDICALKYHSATTTTTPPTPGIYLPNNNNPILGAGPGTQMQPVAPVTARAKRGRMKQNRPV